MAGNYDRCQCGKKKATLNSTCRSCYIDTMRAMKKRQRQEKTYTSTLSICKGCFGEFKSSAKLRHCNKCNNWGNKNGFGPKLLKHNLEVCQDPERKQKILAALILEQEKHPVATEISNKIEAEVARLRQGMTEIVRTDPFSSGADDDGYPVFKTQKCGWRCPQCRQPQKKRSCRLCEMKIRGSI